jgi:hypothetical protein
LQRAINGESSGLEDFSHLRGVGADALDSVKQAFEIKANAGAMPDQVTLTPDEFKRALKDGRRFYLAVFGGLEEGHETVVRIICDPVHTLCPQKSESVSLAGVLSVSNPIEVRFAQESLEPDAEE